MSHHLQAEHITHEIHDCIHHCSECHDICAETVRHCLAKGGSHAQVEHITALLDCAQACDTSRDFMLRGSELHGRFCGVCAEACERCAQSCEEHADADEQMRRCAEACRGCAESCRAMAG